MLKVSIAILFAAVVGIVDQSPAQSDLLVDIHNPRGRDVKCEGFSLDGSESVSIKFTGAEKNRPLWTRAWILNSTTREVVWDTRHAADKDDDRVPLTFDGPLALPKGNYEVYYSYFPYHYYNFKGFSEFMDFLGDKVFRWNDDDDYSSDIKNFSIVIRGKGTRLDKDAIEKLHEEYRKNSFFSMSGLWDSQSEHRGFVLDKPTDLAIYAIGEARSDGTYDYGWIKNTKTNEVVWTMMNRDLKYAGGDRKNRMVNETVSLPAGTYAAFFVTDDSHSAREWNAPPPNDPEMWGMTARVSAGGKDHARLIEYEDVPAKSVILEMTKVRDKEFRSKGFTLKKAMDVRILAIGEGREGEMYDYGWITDPKTNKKVWEMKYFDTEHAGGAEKNRVVDKIVHLEKGAYMAYYVTDGSHSYHDWNSTPPYDQNRWGITLIGAGDSYAANDVAPYDEQDDKTIIARIVRVGDDERKHKSFTLDKDAEVRVYAVGEGRDREMYDYGWITDAKSGRTVWEMTYGMTEPAGGARKNRKFEGTIMLKAGEYTLHFQSDDSHSFEDWNEDPPADPFNWGITLFDASTKISGR